MANKKEEYPCLVKGCEEEKKIAEQLKKIEIDTEERKQKLMNIEAMIPDGSKYKPDGSKGNNSIEAHIAKIKKSKEKSERESSELYKEIKKLLG